MKRRRPLFAFAAFASLAAVFTFAPCEAATLVSVTGNDGVNSADSNYIFATSWTFGVDHTGVSVSGVFGGFGTGRAYLVKDIGVGVTVGSQVATVDFTPGFPVASTVTLFQNLDLIAGTYYLVVQSANGSGVDWRIGTGSTTAQNVTLNSAEYAYGIAPYAPASDFVLNANQYVFTVTGNAAVPEPATTGLALVGATLLVLRRRVR